MHLHCRASNSSATRDALKVTREDEMIKYIAFAAFVLALATSAEALPRVPLHQPDGMSTEARYRGVGVARGYGGYRHYGYGHRRYGYSGYRHYGYRLWLQGYRHYGYRPTATGRTAIGPTVMESPVELLAAISAEESSGSDTPSTEPGRLDTPTFPAQCVS